VRLIVYTENGPIGTVTYENGLLTGSDPGLQEIADSELLQAGSPEAAFQKLRGYTNGYISYVPEEEVRNTGEDPHEPGPGPA
jgi:hypothetical protein